MNPMFFLQSNQKNITAKNFSSIRSVLFFYLYALIAAIALSGCVSTSRVSEKQSHGPLLQKWSDLRGALSGTSPLGSPGNGYITLRHPSAISALNKDIYLIDSGLHRIFRYDLFQKTLTPFTNLSAYPEMNIFVSPDRSVFISDPNNNQVLHFTSDGSQLPSLVSPGNLARPVAVAVNEKNGHIIVADGLFDHFIYFNNVGMTLSVVRAQQSLAIAAMATGPDGIYVADRIGRQVNVLGWDGSFKYTLGSKKIAEPSAIAVSRDNLVFVGDNFDQTINVYRGQDTNAGGSQFLEKFGKPGAGPSSFNGISGLAVDGNQLYAIDSMNSRIQIITITP